MQSGTGALPETTLKNLLPPLAGPEAVWTVDAGLRPRLDGPRPVDLHIKGMEALGATVREEAGYVIDEAPGGRLPGGRMCTGDLWSRCFSNHWGSHVYKKYLKHIVMFSG